MNLQALLVAVVAIALVTPLAGASHTYGSECPPYTLYVPEDSESRTYPVYVMIDEFFSGYWSIWIYAESNGVEGLQRDDDFCYHVDADGNPYTEDTADTIIF